MDHAVEIIKQPTHAKTQRRKELATVGVNRHNASPREVNGHEKSASHL